MDECLMCLNSKVWKGCWGEGFLGFGKILVILGSVSAVNSKWD